MKGQAPVTAGELVDVLRDWGVEMRQGKGGRTVAVVDGVEVGLPSGRKTEVSENTLRLLAGAFGATRKEFRDAVLDRRAQPAGRLAAKVETPETGPSIGEVRVALGKLARRLDRISGWLSNGSRSAPTLARIYQAVGVAAHELSGWPPPDSASPESPDDSGYRPSSPDPVTTGAARAVGTAAKAAKNRTTYTDWQIRERA